MKSSTAARAIPAGRAIMTWMLWAGLALVTAAGPETSFGIDVVHWERLPIAVSLHVEQERVLFLDRPMRVAVPPSIVNLLKVQSANGAVYLRAKQIFESTRIELQDADTGVLLLLDVTATQAAADDRLEPVRIELSKSADNADDSQFQRESGSTIDSHSTGIPTPWAVLLTRYAAQSLYAPLRTVEPVAGIAPAPVHAVLDLTTVLPNLRVSITALAAWRLQDHWVTAVRITNMTTAWQSLDPRNLQGDFVAATFQHPQLGPQGYSTDTTVLYLVTRGHGLAESLVPTVSPVDAARNLNAPEPPGLAHEK